MNRVLRRIVPGIVLASLLWLAPTDAHAQVSEWAFKRLNGAFEAMNENKYDDALTELNRMKDREGRLDKREVAMMYQAFGHLYFIQNKYKPAAAAFEKSLAQEALEDNVILDMRFNLGQLYMALERWNDAVKNFEIWLKDAESPKPDTRFIIAQAYIQKKDWNKALNQLAIAIAAKPKPPENWLQSMGAVQYELKKKRDMITTLKSLVELYPKATYWLQLGGLYSEINDEKRALAVFELAYEGGYVTKPNNIKQLAQMFIYQDVPLKGAQVLEKELGKKTIPRDEEHLKILADAYVRAKEVEKAVPPLQQAAKIARSPDLYLRLTQLLLEEEKWQKAVDSAEAAIKTGKLADSGQAYLLMGIGNYYAGRKVPARRALERAAKSKNATHSNVAKQWLRLIETM